MSVRQFVIGKKKGRVTLHRFAKQSYSFEKIFAHLTQESVSDQALGVRVKIVRCEIRRWPLFDRRLLFG